MISAPIQKNNEFDKGGNNGGTHHDVIFDQPPYVTYIISESMRRIKNVGLRSLTLRVFTTLYSCENGAIEPINTAQYPRIETFSIYFCQDYFILCCA